MSRMYKDVKTWNPYVGCGYQCEYCKSSFQAQRKRLKHICRQCFTFEPHFHMQRYIDGPPKAKIVWPCAHGDFAFCKAEEFKMIVRDCINKKYENRTFYFQTKDPKGFNVMLPIIQGHDNFVLVTTLETNRDKNYRKYSKAPYPTARAADFAALDWPRKIVTIEPIMQFDHDEFLALLLAIKPEKVYIGYNSHPKAVKLPEPTRLQVSDLVVSLIEHDIQIETKYLPWEKNV